MARKSFTLIFLTGLTFLVFPSISQSVAPTLSWQKTFGGSSLDVFSSFCSTIDGGYVIAGKTLSTDSDVSVYYDLDDIWIAKLNNTGGIQWKKTLGGNGIDQVAQIIQTDDGGFIIAASTSSNDADVTGNHGGMDCWIVKLTSLGTIEWQRTFGGSKNDLVTYIQKVSNGFIVVGFSESSDGDLTDNKGGTDYWIFSINKTGTLLWQKNYGGTLNEVPFSICNNSLGNFIIAGQTYSSDGLITNKRGDSTTSDGWVVAIDSVGTLLWQKTFGGSDQDYFTSITQSSAGNIFLGGVTNSNNGSIGSKYGDTTTSDMWIMSIDQSGVVLWSKVYGGTESDLCAQIRSTVDGGIYAVGYTESKNGDVAFNHGNGDIWFVRLKADGTKMWEKTFGGSSQDIGVAFLQNSSGGYSVAGSTWSLDGDVTYNHGSYDYWVLNLSSISLPVGLSSFSAKVTSDNLTTLLDWRIDSPGSLYKYVVQRSYNGVIYNDIGSVLQAENMDKYQFRDSSPLVGDSYYRLKLIDLDGRFSYSNVEKISIIPKQYSLKLYPLPVTSSINVRLETDKSEYVNIVVIDKSGRTCINKAVSLKAGINIIPISVSSLNKGVYYLSAYGEKIEMQQFLKL